MQHEQSQSVHNGRRLEAEHVEIEDTIVVEAAGAQPHADGAGQRREFEVVGIVQDDDAAQRFAVCYSQDADEFIVTDGMGRLLQDEALAQDVLTDFLQHADEAPQEDQT
ncbi:MAG: hypothetical protein M3Z37_04430 [Candidatus Eremiobacteraeota bacterium]|nr:hypothetical protein [Candidatus Eremiobacteraeota bacterium]